MTTAGLLLRQRLPSPTVLMGQFARETARHTAGDLLDETIHLTAAFQLAGYPHVIGTLWTIYDSIAVDVARAFHLAAVPAKWAAYLHTGA